MKEELNLVEFYGKCLEQKNDIHGANQPHSNRLDLLDSFLVSESFMTSVENIDNLPS